MTKSRNLMLAAALTVFTPMAVYAANGPKAAEGQAALDQLRNAAISFQDAGRIALEAHPGVIAQLEFGSENGRPAYEAMVIGQDGAPVEVMVDAMTGTIIAEADAEKKARGDDDEDEGFSFWESDEDDEDRD